MRTVEERFLSHVDVNPSGCWLWTGARISSGYGAFNAAGDPVLAHRWAYERWVGPLAIGHDICHHCDTPTCVRPSHLFLGTRLDNMRDAQRKGRTNRGERNGHARLTERDVRAIRATPRTPATAAALARQFGVTARLIRRILRRDIWTHVP